ncbi:MAG TPA: acyl-CoA synthetase FdrA [Candidatus Limnocylindria bacterium]|nr:acyl-CoA synthetase FdrA [Candidatus Limnocylindria bacterium]
MAVRCVVRERQYFDSVFLMRVADRIGREPGVGQVAAVMGTAANKELLAEAGFHCPEISGTGPNDLVIGVQGERDAELEALLARLDDWLAPERSAAEASRPRTLDQAVAQLAGANLAVISVPGQHAAREARRALDRGLHVFVFSDNVPLEAEIALKRYAAERGLVVMGPDCGTAIIAGKGLGFANVVRRGPIGVIGASGTGIQEVTTLLDRAGSGISHAIGTGSRDPSDDVGGGTTLAALDALDRDEGTQALVVVSKPPGRRTLALIRDRVARAAKPVVACFLGADVERGGAPWTVVRTLDAAATEALRLVSGGRGEVRKDGERAPQAEDATAPPAAPRRYVRGLFAGGSLCYQAQDIFGGAGIKVRSNAPLEGMLRLEDPRRSEGHTFIDLGADEFTRGRPHPMIDPRLRRERILAEAADPEVAVILLDVILGFGCAPDPGGDLADAIVHARRSGRLDVIASVIGTPADPQGLDRQVRALRDAGATVSGSSAEAARLAAAMVAGA